MNPTYKDLYTSFPVLQAFAQRQMPRDSALNVGGKIRSLRSLFKGMEEDRLALVDEHAQHREDGRVVTDGDKVVFENREKFEDAWQDALSSEIDDYPSFNKITPDMLPEDVTPLEIEALVVMQLLKDPGI